jgi:hypothetical protein
MINIRGYYDSCLRVYQFLIYVVFLLYIVPIADAASWELEGETPSHAIQVYSQARDREGVVVLKFVNRTDDQIAIELQATVTFICSNLGRQEKQFPPNGGYFTVRVNANSETHERLDLCFDSSHISTDITFGQVKHR